MSPDPDSAHSGTRQLNLFVLRPSLPVGEDWVRASAVDPMVDVTPIEYDMPHPNHGSAGDRDQMPLRVSAPKLRPSRFFWRANAELAARALSRYIDSRPSAGPGRQLAHGHFYSGSYALRSLQRRTGIPYIVSEHSSALPGANPEKAVSQGGIRRAAWVYEKASAVLPVSQSLADAITAHGIPAPNLQVVYNPVDTELFKPGDNSWSPRVVTVVRLEPVKRVDMLIRSMRSVLHQIPDATLDIAGAGSEMRRLQDLVNKLNIGRAVTFHGRIARRDVAALLRSCSVFALASHTENMPVAALEAAASGLPIVAPAVGGIPELLGIVGGTQYEPGDENALIDGLLRGLESTERDRYMTREAAVDSFSIETIGAQLAEIYRRIGFVETQR